MQNLPAEINHNHDADAPWFFMPALLRAPSSGWSNRPGRTPRSRTPSGTGRSSRGSPRRHLRLLPDAGLPGLAAGESKGAEKRPRGAHPPTATASMPCASTPPPPWRAMTRSSIWRPTRKQGKNTAEDQCPPPRPLRREPEEDHRPEAGGVSEKDLKLSAHRV